MSARPFVSRRAPLVLAVAFSFCAGLVRVATVGAAEAGSPAAPPRVAPAVGSAYLPPAGLGLTVDEVTRRSRTATRWSTGTIVYHSAGDLYVDDIFDDRSPRRIVDNGEEQSTWSPRFVDAGTVSFISQDGLEILDLDSGVRTVVVRDEALLGAYDWTADGLRVAYLATEWSEQQAAVDAFVRIVSRVGASTTIPIGLILPEGYCLHDPDGDIRVEFSPDGSMILVENVAAQPQPSVTVVHVSGKVVLPPSHYAWARFDSPGTLIARDIAEKAWVRLDLASGRSKLLPVPATARRAVRTANGSSIAYDDGVGTIHIVDEHSGETAPPVRGHVRPVWIDDHRFVAFGVTACDGCDEPWEFAGYATLFDHDFTATRLPVDAYGQLDVLR